jgi:hypothetical protein
LTIEFVKSRRVLRFVGWLRREKVDVLEIPVAELCQELGIDATDLGARGTPRYLLFGGWQPRAGLGLTDLIETFEGEEEALKAFRDKRSQSRPDEHWAELCAIDFEGKVVQVAWFGLPSRLPGGSAT